MAESIAHSFKAKTDWVYVGQAGVEAKKPREKKEDAHWQKYLQDVFDVAAPIAISEKRELSALQGNLAVATAEELVKSQAHKEAKQGGMGETITDLDTKLRGRKLPNRLGRLLTFFVMGSGSFALDRVGDVVAQKQLFTKDSLTIYPFTPINLKDSGNKAALEVGWEFVTDALVGKSTDTAAQLATNKDHIGFVSPLSKTLSMVGNTIINVAGAMIDERTKTIRVINSFVNPGFIESAFRFTGALPVVGAPIERIYASANRQIIQSKGVMPFAIDLAYNMLIAKQFSKGPLPNGGHA